MKGIVFVPSVEETAWVQEILPGLSPAELPVAGKRYIDYALEYTVKRGYEMAEVLDWSFSQRVADDFADLTGYEIPVFYQKGEGEMPKSIQDLARQSSPLTQSLDEGITVIWGLRLPGLELKNVHDWHLANMEILQGTMGNTHFTLPGYSAESGVHLGKNVIMERGFEAIKPILLMDDSRCARNVCLEGPCVIGKGAFIDEGAHLKRTVVGDDTYIGTGLELVDKIVMGHRVIDANTGAWVDVEEPGMASRLDGGKGLFDKIINFFLGKSLGRRA